MAATEQVYTYMTRADFAGTFPAPPTEEELIIKDWAYEEREDLKKEYSYEDKETDPWYKSEEDIPDAVGKLRAIYRNLLRLDYDNARTRAGAWDAQLPRAEQKTPLELFAELYEKQNGQPMSEEQTRFMSGLIETVWEGQA